MKEEKKDRRIRYTKAALRQSLLELLEEKPLSGISVKAICERADINRSTFYDHYTDQYDLLHQLEQEAITAFRSDVMKEPFLRTPAERTHQICEMLKYIASDSLLFKSLLSSNCDYSFPKDIMIMTRNYLISIPDLSLNAEPEKMDYAIYFVISGALSMLRKWLSDGLTQPVSEVASLIETLVYSGLNGITSAPCKTP